jgi:hypothetical protein
MPSVLAHLQLARDLVILIGHDELADGLGHHQDLANGAARALSGLFTRIWVITAIKLCARKLLVWFALFRRQRVDDAVDGLGGARGVQGAEHQVAGFRGRHGHGDRLGIAQLADQDHVGIFAHGGAHAFGEGGKVSAELALNHLAVLAAVNEFDRVFEADDVQRAGLFSNRSSMPAWWIYRYRWRPVTRIMPWW